MHLSMLTLPLEDPTLQDSAIPELELLTVPDNTDKKDEPAGSARILLADDEVEILDYLEEFLSDLGYQTVSCQRSSRASATPAHVTRRIHTGRFAG